MATEHMFEMLEFWRDEVARTGAENMAIDQLLMERIGAHPVLRVYRWSEPTLSFGYFLALADVEALFPADGDLHYVRRWTGGGIVDHRIDITYTLAIPRNHSLSRARGAESYCVIHRALAATLLQMGESARLTSGDEGDGALACFDNPVAYDVTDAAGQKMAGAGQRRTRHGLLHQGSVVAGAGAGAGAVGFGEKFTSLLSAEVRPWAPDGRFLGDAACLADDRYATDAWLNKK